MTDYIAPAWLPGGHLQTIYAVILAPLPVIRYRRERWDTPDGDFIDLDWADGPASPTSRPQLAESETGHPQAAPLVVLFHGLEGSSRSHYARTLMREASARGSRAVVVHFRGCSGEPNRLPRAYHSGDSAEIAWILRRLREAHAGPLCAVGVSLGGNALLKWLGETGASAGAWVDRAASVSAPVDLTAAGEALEQGFNLVYAQHFLISLKRKALAKLTRHPGLYDAASVRAATTLRHFDDVVTAPLHGFRDAGDYWTRASSKPLLARIAVPTLIINARNDPFLPCSALPAPHEVAPAVLLEQPENGGHVGFVSGPLPGNLGWLSRRILEFFAQP